MGRNEISTLLPRMPTSSLLFGKGRWRKSRSPIIRLDWCNLGTFGDIASNMGGYFLDIRWNKQVCRSKGRHIDGLGSSACQFPPSISGIVRLNALRSHDVEYVPWI